MECESLEYQVSGASSSKSLSDPNKFNNKDILQLLWNNEKNFSESLRDCRQKFPGDTCFQTDAKVLQNKIKRLHEKCKKLRKHGKKKEVQDLECAFFEWQQKHNDPDNFFAEDEIKRQKLMLLQSQTKDVVTENRNLKRHVHIVESDNDILYRQVANSERKISLLLSVLEFTTTKQKEVLHSLKDKEEIENECKEWEAKYNNLSEQLEETLQDLESKERKILKLSTRNQNKKLKRRDEKIERQESLILEKESQIQDLRAEVNVKKIENDERDVKIDNLKKEKRNLLVKVCRLNKKMGDRCTETKQIDEEIQYLKDEVKAKEAKIVQLEELTESLESPVINGKYVTEIRETIMSLVTEHGVSQKKVNSVIQTVLNNLTGKSLSRLPSTGVKSRIMIEAKRVAQHQLAEAMMKGDGGDPTNLSGNCIHQDGTSKFHRHFQSYQVTTSDNTTYSLGLSEVASGEAKNILEHFKYHIKELGSAISNQNHEKVAHLISTIVATMSDQGSTNPIFTKQLQEFKESILPDVIQDWEHMDDKIKKELCQISGYFCKMHMFVNMASEVDKCLLMAEESICEGKSPFSLGWKESGASRLVRTVGKALTMQGCEKSGVGHHFSTYLKSEGKQKKLVSFRGHTFNHLFCAAGRTYHHHTDIKKFLDTWSDPNELLKSVAFDINEKSYISSIRALGIIDKLITGPLWRIIESRSSILEINDHLEHLRDKLELFTDDASSLLTGTPVFDGTDITKDDVYDSLFSDSDDPVLDTYTQIALELAAGGMLLILERQAKDQLKGGKFYNADESERLRAAAVPTTNTCSERDFAQLDILMRLKPYALTESYESIIMWTNNKTSSWLSEKTKEERKEIIEKAHKDLPKMLLDIKERKNKLHEQKVKILKSKQEKKAMQEEKKYTESVRLTTNLLKVGGLWLSCDQVTDFISENSDESVKAAIITQLQFRKNVIKSKGPRELFQQQHKGKHYNLKELEANLKKIIELNQETEIIEEEEKLHYMDENKIIENVKNAKEKQVQRIREGRNKIMQQQQKMLLPEILETPYILVGKHIKHKFKVDNGETEWFKGVVLRLIHENGRKSKFEIEYEDEDETNIYPLIIDMEHGDLIIVDM